MPNPMMAMKACALNIVTRPKRSVSGSPASLPMAWNSV
jgi:hypothetical protein